MKRLWTVGWAWILAATIGESLPALAHGPPVTRPAPSPEEEQAAQRGLEALFKALGGAEEGQQKPAPLVDHRELRSLLPAELPGYRRVSASSERAGVMGQNIAQARVLFENATGGSVELEIADFGGTQMMPALTAMSGLAFEVDRETDTGYERTINYRGYKALEQYDRAARNGSIQVYVGGRFVVRVEGQKVSMDDLKAALEKVDLKKLESLKPAAPSP